MTCYSCGVERCEDQLTVCNECGYAYCGMNECDGVCACDDTSPERRAWDSVAYVYYHQYRYVLEYSINHDLTFSNEPFFIQGTA
jgi:hypothetical protein